MSEGPPPFPEIGPFEDPTKSVGEKKDKTRDEKSGRASVWEKLFEEKRHTPEKEPPTDHLAGDEKKIIIKGDLPEQQDRLSAEMQTVAPNTPQEAEVLMAGAFYENLEAIVDEKDELEEADIDTALTTTLEEVGYEIPEDEIVLAMSEGADEGMDEVGEATIEADDTEDEDEDTTVPSPPAIVPTGAGSTAPPGGPTGMMGGTGLPTGDVPPGGGGHPLIYPEAWGPMPPGGDLPEAVPLPSAANTIERPLDDEITRGQLVGTALAAGLIGYLIGRRRGRIKTEKKLIPVKRKLEKEVKQLRETVLEREKTIRRIARTKVAEQPAVKQAELIERLETRHRKRANPEMIPEHREQRPTPQTERLGRMILTPEVPQSSEQLKPVDIMTREQILAVAERIPVEQSDVKRLFEAGRLNETGLREVVRVFLRGERYEKVLHDNLTELARFELHPSERQAGEGGVTQSSAPGMVTPTGPAPLTPPPMTPPAVLPMQPATPQTALLPTEAKTKRQTTMRVSVVIGIVLAILVMLFVLMIH